MKNALTPVALAAAFACQLATAQTAQAPDAAASQPALTLPTVTVNASADASAQGLSRPYPGGQVARGGRAGILGTRDNMETPFSITAYTNELIQDRQAKSVGEVLQNDAGVRVARGFGNFQESYFIRGFILGSDDVAYNGLYSLLPRQYIATELFERVEVLRGASAFLNGATPGGGGLGGAVNLLPKRATNEALTRVTLGAGSGGQGSVAIDLGRRFGPDGDTGVRVNAAYRDGGTAVDDENAKLGLFSVGLDWRSRDVRLSGDIGYQDNQLDRARPNVTLGDFANAVTVVPKAPDGKTNFAQPGSYSNERDVFSTLRGEWDITDSVTAYAAYGLRRSDERNSLGNLTVTNGTTGDGYTYRFDNAREDEVDTGEIGVRGKFATGTVKHEWVVSASAFQLKSKNAYLFDFANQQQTNLYDPVHTRLPAFSAGAGGGNDLNDPALTAKTKLTSFAIGDTLAMLDDTLLVTLGARLQKLEVDTYDYAGAGFPNASSYDDDRTSPVLGAIYRFNKQFSVYANYIEGLVKGDVAGGGNPPPVNTGEALAPYVSKQKEIGLKYDSGRLGATAAFFSTTRPRSVIDASNVFTSNGEDRHQGVELNTFGFAADGLKLLGGVTWLDAKQKKTGSAATDGKRVIGVPEWQSNVGVEWDLPFAPGLALDARVLYTGSSHADATNTLKVPDWTRLDIGARWQTDVQGHLLTLRARIDNLADKDYWASVGGYPGAGYLVVGSPRTFNLSASADF